MMVNDLISCPDGQPAIIAERRGNIIKVIKSENGEPIFDYHNINSVNPLEHTAETEELRIFSDFFATAKKYSDIYQKENGKIHKARQGQTVKYLRRVPKKSGKGYDYIYKETKNIPIDSRSAAEPRLKQASPWAKALRPSPEQFDKILSGDGDALGQYFMETFWKPDEDSGMALKNVLFSQQLIGGRPEGFAFEDVAQETVIKLLHRQRTGRIPDNIDKFPSFIAGVFKFTTLELFRRIKEIKFGNKVALDISEMIKGLEDTKTMSAQSALEHEEGRARILESTKRLAVELNTDLNVGNNRRNKEIFERFVSGGQNRPQFLMKWACPWIPLNKL